MSSMDPMKDGSWILSETMRKISLRPSRFHQLQNTKSSSLMRQITQPTMYNSSYGLLLRSLAQTVDSSSPVTTKTVWSSHSTPAARVLIFPPIVKTDQNLQHNSSPVSKKSWVQKVLNMITRSW